MSLCYDLTRVTFTVIYLVDRNSESWFSTFGTLNSFPSRGDEMVCVLCLECGGGGGVSYHRNDWNPNGSLSHFSLRGWWWVGERNGLELTNASRKFLRVVLLGSV